MGSWGSLARSVRVALAALTTLIALAAAAPARAADTLALLLFPNRIGSVSADDLGTLLAPPPALTGLEPGFAPAAIDWRPADAKLYLLTLNITGTDKLRLYAVDPVTGVATQTGAESTSPAADDSPALSYGMDFDPVSGLLRVVAGTANFTIDANTGVATNRTGLAFAIGDPSIPSGPPNPLDVAYDRNLPGGAATTLFAIHQSPGAPTRLVRIGGVDGSPSPDDGVTSTVGDLAPAFTPAPTGGGFDVGDRSAIAYGLVNAAFSAELYRVNLATGAGAPIGSLGLDVSDVAVAPAAVVAFASSSVSAFEGGSATVTLTRGGATSSATTVDVATSDGSATAGSDYTATTTQLVFAPGETTKPLTIPTTQDSVDEGRESFTVEITAARGSLTRGAVATRRLATVVINDDDAAAAIKPPPLVLSFGKVPASITLAKLRKFGVSVPVTPGRAAKLTGELLATARTARIAAANLVVASRSLPLAAGTRTLKFKPSRKLIGTPTKAFKLTIRVRGTDADGVTAVVQRTLKVTLPKKKKAKKR
jgi:hypothetical protein